MKNKILFGSVTAVVMTALAFVVLFLDISGVLLITLVSWVGLSYYLLFLDIRVSKLEARVEERGVTGK